jgi:hypothetical protein
VSAGFDAWANVREVKTASSMPQIMAIPRYFPIVGSRFIWGPPGNDGTTLKLDLATYSNGRQSHEDTEPD